MSTDRRYVMDTSVLIKFLVPEPETAFVRQLVRDLLAEDDSSIHVPDLLYIECANVMWKKVQRGEVRVDTAEQNLAELLALDLPTTSLSEVSVRAMRLACDHRITVYDACYLALAERLNTPLLTADARLANTLAGTAHSVVTLALLMPASPELGGD